MNCFKSLILAPVFRSRTEVHTYGCAHSQRCSWPRMGWSLVSEEMQAAVNQWRALRLKFCSRTNCMHRMKYSQTFFEHMDILGEIYFFFSPQVGWNFTAGNEIKPELCFQKHVISTNSIIQKHIIIMHSRSPAL